MAIINRTNTTDNTQCAEYEWYSRRSETIFIPVYYFFMPIYITFGLTGRSLLLRALWKNSVQERAYWYLIIVLISEILEIVIFALHVTSTDLLSGSSHPDHSGDWFTECYACMWFTAHLSAPLLIVSVTNTMFLTISMSLDRLYALCRPIEYRNTPDRTRKRRQIVTVILCLLIAISINMFDCFRFQVIPANGSDSGARHKVIVDELFLNCLSAKIGTHFRSAVCVLGVLSLVVVNILVVVAHRRRIRRSANLFDQRMSPDRVNLLTAAEKNLFLLAISQSILSVIGVMSLVGFYIATYTVTNFPGCQDLLWTPMVDAAIQISDLADFYLVILISKNVRRLFLSSISSVRWRNMLPANL